MFDWLVSSLSLVFGLVVAAGVAFFKVKGLGKKEEQLKQTQQRLEDLIKKNEVQREVDRLPSGDAAKRLRDSWSRD